MLKTNVPDSKFLCTSHFNDESNAAIRYFVRFVVFRAEGGLLETIFRATTTIGAKVQTVCRYPAHRPPQGLPLFHDSIITPTLKYQTAAVGSRRKESHTGTCMNVHVSFCMCTVHVQLLQKQKNKKVCRCVKRKISNQLMIHSFHMNPAILESSKEFFLSDRTSLCVVLLLKGKLILCIARHHQGYLRKHVAVV